MSARRKMPWPVLPETTLRWEADAPPMRRSCISEVPLMRMPSRPLGRDARPVTSVPMRLPTIVMLSASPVATIPSWVAPEMMLNGPITAPSSLSMWMPSSPGPAATVPVMSVPM